MRECAVLNVAAATAQGWRSAMQRGWRGRCERPGLCVSRARWLARPLQEPGLWPAGHGATPWSGGDGLHAAPCRRPLHEARHVGRGSRPRLESLVEHLVIEDVPSPRSPGRSSYDRDLASRLLDGPRRDVRDQLVQGGREGRGSKALRPRQTRRRGPRRCHGSRRRGRRHRGPEPCAVRLGLRRGRSRLRGHALATPPALP